MLRHSGSVQLPCRPPQTAPKGATFSQRSLRKSVGLYGGTNGNFVLVARRRCKADRGGERAAAIYTLIATAKLNSINPQAWLADVLARIADYPALRLDELLPWYWKPAQDQAAAA